MLPFVGDNNLLKTVNIKILMAECADRELLPAFHEVSVYPKKELPFFILFTAGLCSFTALLALLTHQYPESMGVSGTVLAVDILFKCDTIAGDRPHHPDVGVRAAPLHPGEGGLGAADLAPPHAVQDVAPCLVRPCHCVLSCVLSGPCGVCCLIQS